MATATQMQNVQADDFLGEQYEMPESSGSGGKYLKFKDGTVHFRVMSPKALKGWEYWTEEGKPSRTLQKPDRTPENIRIGEDGKPERIRHFWVMVVWDYESESLKILQITQATIQKAIVALVKDKDFGHPTNYDLKVSRSGKALETEYNVMPLHKLCPETAIAAFASTPIYLEALLHNADPFAPDSAQYVEPAVRVAAPNAIDRLSALRALTGHTKQQVIPIALSVDLKTSEAAQWTQEECDRFRDALLLDFAAKYQVFNHEKHRDSAFKLIVNSFEFAPSDEQLFEAWKADLERRSAEKSSVEVEEDPIAL